MSADDISGKAKGAVRIETSRDPPPPEPPPPSNPFDLSGIVWDKIGAFTIRTIKPDFDIG